ncbi:MULTISPECIES: YheT family hydrolase [unclassified Moraxella]|uniref:YheT family hydrolase n=1 Tax=unclassified Moraxella TaxID=2685852 RepID=UPI003AF7F3D1
MPTLHQLPLKPFRTPFFLSNPHVQTILPKFIKLTKPNYQRHLHADRTGTTQVAYDFVFANADGSPNTDKPLAMMFHGLEGSSDSHYAVAFASHAKNLGLDAVIVHYRGCGGVTNTAELDYNAGDTAEAQHVFTWLKQHYGYQHILASGVSLGGNMLARYMGEQGDNALCDGAVVISAPVDLTTSAKAMHRFVAKRVYTPYLLNPLLAKAFAKIEDPELVNALKNIKTIDQFDELYTAPRHGYGTGADYYVKASALPVLKNITKPTLIITAKDDPFLGIIASQADVSPSVRLLYSEHGGHVGFVSLQRRQAWGEKLHVNWLPQTTFKFFEWIMGNDKSSNDAKPQN